MKIVGLTGGIATGKSTASRYLVECGCDHLDGDILSRKIVEKGQPALHEIERTFGKQYLKDDGTLNRQKLGALIFSHPEMKEKLDAIMQPRLISEIQSHIVDYRQHGKGIYIVDMPLLFEWHLEDLMDEVIMITTTYSLQKERLMQRNHLTEQEADERIDSQWPLIKKEALADTIIENNGNKEKLFEQLNQWLASQSSNFLISTYGGEC